MKTIHNQFILMVFIYMLIRVSMAYEGQDSYGGGDDSESYSDNEHGGGDGDGGGGGDSGGGGGHGHDDGGGDHSIDAAVNSKHSVETYAVQTEQDAAKTPVVDINSGPLSLKIRFNSHSSNIDAVQNHFGSKGQVKKSSSIDHPDILIHSIKKPVIQEIKEIITPYRKRVLSLKPVQEKLETIIATGHGDGHGYGGGGGGGGHGGHGGGGGGGHGDYGGGYGYKGY